jgi:organic hydroperoxide reductase OsmC/OhrA
MLSSITPRRYTIHYRGGIMAPTAKTFSYEVALEWRGDRRSVIAAGDRSVILSGPPADFPLGEGERWSPEHLFLGSISSCTMLSYLAHAAHRGVDVTGYTATASGTVTRRAADGRYAFVTVAIEPVITVAPGQVETALALTAKAERDCFISASTTAEVTVNWEISEP